MTEIHDIPRMLSANGGAILDNISEASIADYAWLKMNLGKVDVTQDDAFRERFQDFYQFNTYRIKPIVRKRVFEVMEEAKSSETHDMRQIAMQVMNDVDLKTFRLKQFYPVTTIMHTINDQFPLYDRYSESLFDFDAPEDKQISSYRQLTMFVEQYESLTQTYESLLQEEALLNLIKVVKIKFPAQKDVLSAHKRMDLVLRSAGELHLKGVLVRGARRPATA